MKRKTYVVNYGGSGYSSNFKSTNWKDCCDFMKHLLDNNETIKAVYSE